MRLLTVVAGVVLGAAIGNATMSQARAQSPTSTPPSYSITGLQARLYYAQNGALSENVLDKPGGLRNVVIGEGIATSPSYSTLVLVEVQGPAKARVDGRAVELTVTEQTPQNKLKLKRSIAVKRLGATGRYYAAFWLDDTGCIPLVLVAHVIGQVSTPTVQRLLAFECGE